MIDYTVQRNINAVKRKIALPGKSQLYTDDQILEFLDDHLQTICVPLISRTNSDYFVRHIDTPINSNEVYFQVPQRALGAALYDISVIKDGIEDNVARFSPGDSLTAQLPRNYCIIRGNIVIYTSQTSFGDTLRVYFYNRPGHLISTGKTGQILSVSGNVVNMNFVPSSWVNGMFLDVVQAFPPFDTVAYDVTLISRNNLTLTLSNATGFVKSDYVVEAESSPVAQVPLEGQRFIELGACMAITGAMSDEKMFKMITTQYLQQKEALLDILVPRIRHEVQKISQRSGLGIHSARRVLV